MESFIDLAIQGSEQAQYDCFGLSKYYHATLQSTLSIYCRKYNNTLSARK